MRSVVVIVVAVSILVLAACVRGPVIAPEQPACAFCTTAVSLDSSNFDEFISATRVAMVDFFSPTCAACRALDPVVESLAVAYSGRVLVAKADPFEDRGLGQRFGISVVPTFVFFREGVEQQRRRGSELGDRPGEALGAIIDGLLGE